MKKLINAGVEVYTIGFEPGRISLNGLIRLFKLIRRTRPDAVQTWMYHADILGGVVAKLCGIRAVVWGIRAADAHCHGVGPPKVVLWITAAISYLIPRLIIFPSRVSADVHQQLGYAGKKIQVIANGFDTQQFSPNPESGARLRSKLKINRDVTLIGMVARWDPLKDHETFFSALQRLIGVVSRPWTCLLIGPGMTIENTALQRIISQFGVSDNVRLWGPCGDVACVMNALDIHVLSSKSESFPNVLAEAMACGTPCVATDVGDAKLIVDSTGWIVPRSDPTALANALETAIGESEHSEMWALRRQACRQRIEQNFRLAEMIDKFDSAWNRVADD